MHLPAFNMTALSPVKCEIAKQKTTAQQKSAHYVACWHQAIRRINKSINWSHQE